jgi:hypothetical protein
MKMITVIYMSWFALLLHLIAFRIHFVDSRYRGDVCMSVSRCPWPGGRAACGRWQWPQLGHAFLAQVWGPWKRPGPSLPCGGMAPRRRRWCPLDRGLCSRKVPTCTRLGLGRQFQQPPSYTKQMICVFACACSSRWLIFSSISVMKTQLRSGRTVQMCAYVFFELLKLVLTSHCRNADVVTFAST